MQGTLNRLGDHLLSLGEALVAIAVLVVCTVAVYTEGVTGTMRRPWLHMSVVALLLTSAAVIPFAF